MKLRLFTFRSVLLILYWVLVNRKFSRVVNKRPSLKNDEGSGSFLISLFGLSVAPAFNVAIQKLQPISRTFA
ncbi:hypothetical protein [Spirosoma endophyticum]|uniref:Uncharacterized protein n=1 Tax=Spirosoma endophyticum TaxID=662367 RepID=A0A1I1QN84_9BACT|nr:hypothetical protein [Spirosoma endophyticum]SFD23477.1 hypothetical protein SAMN05216167_10431 [Spirosoma endophyticum]